MVKFVGNNSFYWEKKNDIKGWFSGQERDGQGFVMDSIFGIYNITSLNYSQLIF